MLQAARWNTGRKNRQKFAICAPSHNFVGLHLRRRHVSTIRKKNLLNSNISSTVHMSSQYGELRPTSGWDRFSLGRIPANFNGFRVLASLLHRRRSMDVNQSLHDVLLSPWLVHYLYIHISGGSCPVTESCYVHNSLCVQVLRSPILGALLHGTRAAAWYKKWN